MTKIVIACNNYGCLGHEIHITRFVIVDMFLQKYIQENDVLVTRNDRKFLYTKLFKNVLNFEEYLLLDANNYKVIDLSHYTHSATSTGIYLNIENFSYIDKFYTPEFIDKILSIEFIDTKYDEKFCNDYIIVHHRYNDDSTNLTKTIEKIFNIFGSTINIIIFNNNISKLKHLENKNILLVDNLQMYASYLNGYKSKYRCKLLISEWSGGGQLSQYCLNNGNIMYYFNYYQGANYVNISEVLKKKAHEGSYFEAWDFKNLANSNMQLFINLENLLENIVIS